MDEDIAALKRQLRRYRANEAKLLETVASYGGEVFAPLNVRNQLEQQREQIAQIEGRLQQQGTPTTDGDSTSPGAELPLRALPLPPRSTPIPRPVTLTVQQDGDQLVALLTDETGLSSSAPFTPPYSVTELPLVLRALDVLQFEHYPWSLSDTERRLCAFAPEESRLLERIGLWRDQRVIADAARIVGKRLYASLSSHEMLTRSVSEQPLRLLLHFAGEQRWLATLPWELLGSEDLTEGHSLAYTAGTSIERVLDRTRPSSWQAQTPAHILLLAPAYGIATEQRNEELRAHERVWQQIAAQQGLSYQIISPLTRQALLTRMQPAADRPTIVHYLGNIVQKDGESRILFDGTDVSQELVKIDELKRILGDTVLLVLVARQSLVLDPLGWKVLRRTMPVEHLRGLRSVSLQFALPSAQFVRFAELFYTYLLAYHLPLHVALASVRNVLALEASHTLSWASPVLST